MKLNKKYEDLTQMPEAIRKELVARLRSGKYKQGEQFLCSVDSKGEESHCCLGILAEMAVEADLAEKVKVDDKIYFRSKGDADDMATHYLPKDIAAWAKIGTRGQRPGGLFASSLAALNDAQQPFEEIADIIEADTAESEH